MSLDQRMAFTVSDDHKAQEGCWQLLPEWNRQSQAIRRALTEAHIEANSRPAVGIETYRQASGSIAVASAVIRARARGRFFNLVDLVNHLEQEEAAGRTGRLSEKLLRYDIIVIDELGYLPFS